VFVLRDMTQHFNEISGSYNDLRTTDYEPISYMKEKLRGMKIIHGADIGCGGGRYGLLMLQQIKGLHLICADINKNMVDKAENYLKTHGQKHFTVKQMEAEQFDIPLHSLNFVSSFNAIHHFSLPLFIGNSSKTLKKNGYIFIYTRLQSQNKLSVWGKYFPEFTLRENRLLDLAQVDEWSNQITSVRLENIRFFYFKRYSSLNQLMDKAEGKHYSTFSLYSDAEFHIALSGFRENIQKSFSDINKVEWQDGNVMFTFRKNQ
jgi:cyclopropane fatty-acyl-phospholipid synthase-like methyltransferase